MIAIPVSRAGWLNTEKSDGLSPFVAEVLKPGDAREGVVAAKRANLACASAHGTSLSWSSGVVATSSVPIGAA